MSSEDKRLFIALNFMWMKFLKLLFCLPIAEHILALDIRENSLFLGQLFYMALFILSQLDMVSRREKWSIVAVLSFMEITDKRKSE